MQVTKRREVEQLNFGKLEPDTPDARNVDLDDSAVVQEESIWGDEPESPKLDFAGKAL